MSEKNAKRFRRNTPERTAEDLTLELLGILNRKFQNKKIDFIFIALGDTVVTFLTRVAMVTKRPASELTKVFGNLMLSISESQKKEEDKKEAVAKEKIETSGLSMVVDEGVKAEEPTDQPEQDVQPLSQSIGSDA